jgi:uncharacterized membrane protein YcjF (UPF0283 family)
MDPASALNDFANDWGPVWALVVVLLAGVAYLVRELFRLHRQTLEERAKSRMVIQQLIVAVKQLSERLRWSRER